MFRNAHPDNPYDAPKSMSREPASGLRAGTLIGSIVAVFVTAAIGGLVGMGVGAALAVLVPDYYRSVFAGGSQPGFNPVAVGIGLGLTQGLLFGGVAGVALVALFYWYRLRLARIGR